jgi:hypothetical protein
MSVVRTLLFCAALSAATMARAAAPAPEFVDKRVVLASFADCLARMGPAQSEALLRSRPATDAERRAAQTLVHAHSSCMTDRMVLSMNAPMIRGLVAEAMFKRRHPDWLVAAQALPPTTPARPARPIRASAGEKDSDMARERAFMAAYSGCLAWAAPAQVAKVLATAVASPEEKQAILALGGDLNDCMPFGVRYQLNPGGLRSNLASALYLQLTGRTAASEGAR